tara:strand:- start:91 stop:420 length:330 start_codon:yes stop_codon:yes gene_type:complete
MDSITNDLYQGMPLYYPIGIKHVWTYCTYLGPFTSSNGFKFDLGLYIPSSDKLRKSINNYSCASMFDNNLMSYVGGHLKIIEDSDPTINEVKREVIIRAEALNLIPLKK